MQSTIALYQSPLEDCPYRDGLQSQNLFIDPEAPLSNRSYALLLQQGFRRSGDYVYRPACPDCRACISVRLPVERFRPRRIHRRLMRQYGARLDWRERPALFDEQHYVLYRRYIDSRHPDGGMADTDPERYLRFLTCDWGEVRFFELRLDDELLAVAVTDLQPDSLSAVYTFFDPEHSAMSPGVLSILMQIEETKRHHLDWLYLGYWVTDCRKMRYKSDYRPLQLYLEQQWIECAPGDPLPQINL